MIDKRNEKTMIGLITQIAKNDERVRAVIMNGSRTSPSAKKDMFQDYDIVYLVTNVKSFVEDKNWINRFGDILIMQRPDEMDGNWPKYEDKFTYLMLFKDWNRIDLTLLNLNNFFSLPRDSQSLLLLDKDNKIKKLDPPSDQDYLPKPPTEKEFHDCCNEFLWVTTYVAKGIWRKELTYAKHVAEQIVKEELLKLLTWYVGYRTHYQNPIGKFCKNLAQYLEPELWQQFTDTYVDAEYKNMWNSLFKMCDLFNDIALKISHHFDYPYNQDEYHAVVEYLYAVKNNAS